ncbi:MAG: hypothetical protein HUJ31_06410, partial [Pseudomonadales bacterium]|nr:hypothetical protein [Pseudomonadales bacterium]
APGYIEGGTLNMARLDADNHVQYVKPPEPVTIPAYSVAAVAPLQNGNFLVLY